LKERRGLAAQIAKQSKLSKLRRPPTVRVYHSCVPLAMVDYKARPRFESSLF
jgi:hypothetical protein